MIKRFLSYGGYDWVAAGYDAGLDIDDAHGAWGVVFEEHERPGVHPAIGAGAIGVRRIVVDFTFANGVSAATIYTAFTTLMGNLAPDAPHDPDNPRYLVAELADGTNTQVRVPAVIERPHDLTPNGGRNGFLVTFLATDPAWRAVTPTHVDQNGLTGNHTAGWQSAAVNNTGGARAYPVITLDPTGGEAAGGRYKYRHSLILTNTLAEDIVGEAIELNLGNTTGWVSASGGAASNGSDVQVLRDGMEVPRQLIGFNTTQSYAWVYLDHVPAGKAVQLDFVYPLTGSGPIVLDSTAGRPYRPAWDFQSFNGTTTSGSTTNVVNIAGSPGWYDKQWISGTILFLTGALAGTSRNISGSTSNTITVATALPSSPASGVSVLIRKSQNAKLVYNVLQVNRPEFSRGLWVLDSAEFRPTEVRFDTPGCWEHNLFLENRDQFNQTDYLYIDISGDKDPFSILDCDRAGQGTSNLKNTGAADGLAFHSVFPLTFWGFDGAFKNPNGICKAFFGSRIDETRDWTDVREVTTATDATTLQTFANATNALAGGTRHLVAAVLPADEELIGPTWARDTGSRTSGGTAAGSTMTDGTKAGKWATDQFAGGFILLTRGTGAGRRRTVTAITASTGQITISGTWGVDLDDTTQYEIVNKTLVATLRSNEVWVVERDTSGLTVGALGAQALTFPARLLIRVDGASTPVPPYYQLSIGQGRPLWSTSTGVNVVLDCLNRRATLTDNSGNELADVTAYVISQYVRADGTIDLAEEWLPLSPGSHTIYVLAQGLTLYDIDYDTRRAWMG